MTKKWTNQNLPGALHYLTGNVRHRIPIFNQDKCCLAFVEVTHDKRFNLKAPDKDASIHQVWQDSFKAIPLWSDWMIWQKIHYIHANPVRARLVNSAKDYKWSSFRAFYSDSKEPMAVDREWWWPEDSENF